MAIDIFNTFVGYGQVATMPDKLLIRKYEHIGK